jgi:preprotein translocase subunit SecB
MTEENKTAAAASEATGPQLSLQRFYLKDCSFESPNPVAAFQGMSEWKPQMNLNLTSSNTQVGENAVEVVLKVEVDVKQDDNTIYLVEVQQAGVFLITGIEGEDLKQILASYCPSLLYPYAREAISDLVSKGGFPQLLLQPVNFDRLYQQAQKSAAAPTEGNA